MTKTTFQEKMVQKAFNRIADFYVGGQLNAFEDEDITVEEYEDSTSVEDIMGNLRHELNYAIKNGYLDLDEGGMVIEAKHLKFMGNVKLESMMEKAAIKSLNNL